MIECHCTLCTYRDTIAYGLSALSYSLSEVMKVLAEVVWRPRFSQEQVKHMPQLIMYCIAVYCAAQHGVAVCSV